MPKRIPASPIQYAVEPSRLYEIKETNANYLPQSSPIIVGDAKDKLRLLRPNFFQSCITSPPYWGIRDYGVEDQLGAEKRLNDYINNLRQIFEDVRRVLRDDGTFWLNIGDCYTSGGRSWRAPDKKNSSRAMRYRPPTPEGLKPKDLIGIPWRIALALQKDGWFLRADIIWHKPNAQPESVKDRPTRAHEYVFLFSKSEHYYYDHQSSLELDSAGTGKRNSRTVWSIKTEAEHPPHLAVFPPELVYHCIVAGTKPDDFVLDPFAGSGTVGLVCRQMNRRFLGIEIKPEYAVMADNRMRKLDNENKK